MSDLRILIVEDEPLIAADIAASIEEMGFTATGIAYSADTAMEELKSNTPDIVLLDIQLNKKGQEGIEIAQLINEKYGLPFIYLTSFSDKKTLQEAKTTEPYGYVVKPFNEAGLYAAIEIALYNHTQKNKSKFPELLLDKINKQLAVPFTIREFEVLELIYNGNTNNQIAEKLFISINTVKKRINAAYLKMDTGSRTAALAKLRNYMLTL
jgi:DNA-binding NarL/FixJ family response regulator